MAILKGIMPIDQWIYIWIYGTLFSDKTIYEFIRLIFIGPETPAVLTATPHKFMSGEAVFNAKRLANPLPVSVHQQLRWRATWGTVHANTFSEKQPWVGETPCFTVFHHSRAHQVWSQD